MEPASSTPGMSLPENLRPKQIEAIKWFMIHDSLVGKFPTGYGKTLIGAGAFAQLRYRGACNRMLYVVARRNQAMQAAEDLPAALALFGINTKSIVVGENPIQAIRSHAKGEILVYIVLVQSLLSRGIWTTIGELMQTGKWFVVVDEHHHYGNGEDTAWTGRIKSLNYTAILAMSATPNRYDGSDHFGEPQITETYRDAARAGFVKRVSLHAYHYEIDAVTVDGVVQKFTTEELAEAAGGANPEAIDAFMSSRRMRFSPKYVSPLVTFPLDRIIDLRVGSEGSPPIKSQMIIQAMSCNHARCVVDQVRSLLPPEIRVDWVGTGPNGRSDAENAKVLREFCPPKDKITGRRPWTLDVLVNVGMAGEGTDCMDVTEVVFLTPANITITNLQTIGRGSRIMNVGEQPTCHVNVDSGSEMAKFVGAAVMDLFEGKNEPEEDEEHDDDRDQRAESEYTELPEKLSWMIADVRLVDIRSEPMFKAILDLTKIDLARKFNRQPTDEEIAEHVERGITAYLNRSSNKTAILAQLKEQVESASRKLAGLVARRMENSGIRIERTLRNDLYKRINGAKKRSFGSVTNADEDTLDKHWDWLRRLEADILSAPGVEGIPQWLR